MYSYVMIIMYVMSMLKGITVGLDLNMYTPTFLPAPDATSFTCELLHTEPIY